MGNSYLITLKLFMYTLKPPCTRSLVIENIKGTDKNMQIQDRSIPQLLKSNGLFLIKDNFNNQHVLYSF